MRTQTGEVACRAAPLSIDTTRMLLYGICKEHGRSRKWMQRPKEKPHFERLKCTQKDNIKMSIDA
jgi:hypothetical protein